VSYLRARAEIPSRVIKAQKQRVEEMQGTCEAHERNIQQLQVRAYACSFVCPALSPDAVQSMLRQAAEDKEAAIKMRAVLQAELAQKQPRVLLPPCASAAATSQELVHSRLHLESWAAAQVIDDVMQNILHQLCHVPHAPPALSSCALATPLQPDGVLRMCASMAAASELLLQPAAATPAENSRKSVLENERSERALAQAHAARDAALKQNVRLQEVIARQQLWPPHDSTSLASPCRLATTWPRNSNI
jgi:hypothetical protein